MLKLKNLLLFPLGELSLYHERWMPLGTGNSLADRRYPKCQWARGSRSSCFFTNKAHKEEASPRKGGWSCSLLPKPLTGILWSFRRATCTIHGWACLWASVKWIVNILSQYQIVSGTFNSFDYAYTANNIRMIYITKLIMHLLCNPNMWLQFLLAYPA